MHQTSFEISQFPPVSRDGAGGGRQEHSQLRLRQHGTFNAQNQPPELGAIGH
jgi:hypothetical protein